MLPSCVPWYMSNEYYMSAKGDHVERSYLPIVSLICVSSLCLDYQLCNGHYVNTTIARLFTKVSHLADIQITSNISFRVKIINNARYFTYFSVVICQFLYHLFKIAQNECVNYKRI